MSLARIRTIRRNGGKPGIATVVIGGPGRDDPLVVHIGERADPKAMDWTSLMGVWVTVHWLSGDKAVVHGVINALEAVGAKLFGASGPSFAVSLTGNRSEAEIQAVRDERESLCTA